MAYTVIDDAGANQNNVIYTGDGSTQAITGVGFQPDFVWLKRRDTTGSNMWLDAVRTATKGITSNGTDTEETQATGLTAFDADGFTLGGQVSYNGSGGTFVGWNWKGGTTSGIDTTGSTITPTGYSFNAAAGFSVIEYAGNATSGALVPHGLGAVHEMIIFKNLDSARDWSIYHHFADATYAAKGSPEDDYLVLNTTAAKTNDTGMWNDTAPTSVNISLGNGNTTNESGDQIVAYSFKGVQGFSRFGWYYGSNTITNDNGQFVYCGFRPSWIMLKSSSSTSDWYIFDDKREGYNSDNNELLADTNAAGSTTNRVDFTSNGFKFLATGDPNDAVNYVYAAFAQSPLVNSEGIPNNAR